MNAKKKKKLAASNEEQRKTLGALHWVYQKAMSDFAQKLFKYLDEDLRPRFLILGIPQGHSRPVWLEPSEDSGYIPKFFDRVVPLAKDIEAEEVAKNAWKNPSRRNSKIRPSAKSIQKAVQNILNDKDTKFVSYCAEPATIGEYEVCCVLQFEEPAFHNHYSVPVQWRGDARLSGSLIDATAVEFLRVCRTVLSGPRKTLDLQDPLGHQPEDILRMGGREFMLTANHIGAGTTFDDINELSWKTHEGEIAGGEIYFIHWDEHHLDIPVEFKNPPRLSNIDAARKLIEMAGAKRAEGGKLRLVSHGDAINGIGGLRKLKDKYGGHDSHVFIVKFTGYYRWELWHKDGGGRQHKDGGIMMRVINGVPSLPRQPLSEGKFKDHVRRTFTQTKHNEDALWNIVDAARGQGHGTMIVISSAAAEEANRLADQSTVLKAPVKLVGKLLKETLLMLTSIDGALLVDPKGKCYAAGVILDGAAIKGKGNSSRGARYNSAIRYVYGARTDTNKGQCLAVVISKDRTLNLVRELREQISHSEITERIEKVHAAVADKTVDAKEYYKAIFWLSDHRFYLSLEECNELNHLKEATKPRLLAQEGQAMTPADFKPDEEMDDSCFFDESS